MIVYNHFGNTIKAPVTYVKDLGDNRALVHVETKLHLEDGRDLRATYSTGSKTAEGHYRISAKVWTHSQTYIYIGVFTRE